MLVEESFMVLWPGHLVTYMEGRLTGAFPDLGQTLRDKIPRTSTCMLMYSKCYPRPNFRFCRKTRLRRSSD